MINVSKHQINPSNLNKGIGAEWADSFATWADTFFGWADVQRVTNIDKSIQNGILDLQNGLPFLLQDGTDLELQCGCGVAAWNNLIKH